MCDLFVEPIVGEEPACAGVDGFSSPRFDGALGVTEDERKV